MLFLYWPASSGTALFNNDETPRQNSRSARSIARILESAAALFGREGYRGASMLDVAQAAGVSKGLLHYHFRSKEHLLLEAQRATFRQLFARFRDRFRRGERGLDAALEALDALWDAVREMHAWAPFMLETLSLGTQEGLVREDLDRFQEEALEMIREGLVEVFADDHDRLRVPPDRLALLIWVAIRGLILELPFANSDADRQRVDRAYRDMRTLLAEGILTVEPVTSEETT